MPVIIPPPVQPERITATRTYYVSILTGALLSGGAGYVDGTYIDVPLTGGSGTGAVADIVVSGGAVTKVKPSSKGANYTVLDTLSANAADLGGAGAGFAWEILAIGDNANNGVTNATPWLTPQYAYDWICDHIDVTLAGVNVQLAPGVWQTTQSESILGATKTAIGSQSISFVGNAGDRSLVTWRNTSGANERSIFGTGGGPKDHSVRLSSIQLFMGHTNWPLVECDAICYVGIQNCDFGGGYVTYYVTNGTLALRGQCSYLPTTPPTDAMHVEVVDRAFVIMLNDYAIDLPAGVHSFSTFIYCILNSQIDFNVTLTGAGTVVGRPCIINSGGAVRTSDPTTIPGSIRDYIVKGGGTLGLYNNSDCRVASDFPLTSQAVLQDVPGVRWCGNYFDDGVTYSFRADIFTTSGASGGIKFALAAGAHFNFSDVRYDAIVTEGTSVVVHDEATSFGGAIADITAVTAAKVSISGTFTISTMGPGSDNEYLQLQFCQNVSDGTASVVKRGSFMTLEAII